MYKISTNLRIAPHEALFKNTHKKFTETLQEF